MKTKNEKLIKIISATFVGLMLTGCSLTKDSLEDATIYTTVYPIEYLQKVYIVIMQLYHLFILAEQMFLIIV